MKDALLRPAVFVQPGGPRSLCQYRGEGIQRTTLHTVAAHGCSAVDTTLAGYGNADQLLALVLPVEYDVTRVVLSVANCGSGGSLKYSYTQSVL